ncbi:hypothetical protein ROZALSC1DRAFT_22314 [Rozella allomycis CSF55]|uniref:Uncharacterized protein n=1 Tax=Rozella allomycis (strain CSF55) TaxID=988480 RepID=A0A4P9YJ33_ROZAC|nr:hypothetical protein ROZALSC1DRAFT_22314 [Rozella allomycis CSF55]
MLEKTKDVVKQEKKIKNMYLITFDIVFTPFQNIKIDVLHRRIFGIMQSYGIMLPVETEKTKTVTHRQPENGSMDCRLGQKTHHVLDPCRVLRYTSHHLQPFCILMTISRIATLIWDITMRGYCQHRSQWFYSNAGYAISFKPLISHAVITVFDKQGATIFVGPKLCLFNDCEHIERPRVDNDIPNVVTAQPSLNQSHSLKFAQNQPGCSSTPVAYIGEIYECFDIVVLKSLTGCEQQCIRCD